MGKRTDWTGVKQGKLLVLRMSEAGAHNVDCVAEWCELLGLNYRAVIQRLVRGTIGAEALTKPFRRSPVRK